MGFHASEHGFHGLVYFMPILGGDARCTEKWQQKVKRRERKMKTKVIHAFLWILVCMVLGITCYQCRDLRGYVILSGSMEPVIPTGSVAVVDSSKRDVRPGNIATFERHGDLVTHRILSKTEEGYQTKGDANTDPDSGTIPAEKHSRNISFSAFHIWPWIHSAKTARFNRFSGAVYASVSAFPEKKT